MALVATVGLGSVALLAHLGNKVKANELDDLRRARNIKNLVRDPLSKKGSNYGYYEGALSTTDPKKLKSEHGLEYTLAGAHERTFLVTKTITTTTTNKIGTDGQSRAEEKETALLTDSVLSDSGRRYFGELTLGDGRIGLDPSLFSLLPFRELTSTFKPAGGGVNVNVNVDPSSNGSGNRSRSENLGVRENVSGIVTGTELTVVADFRRDNKCLKASASRHSTIVVEGGFDELVRARQSEASVLQTVSYGACAGAAIGLLAMVNSK